MAPGRTRDERKERQWRRWIARWRASGLSVRAFCDRRGSATPSFYNWRRTLQRRADQPTAFVPVQVVADAPPAQASALGRVLADGRIVRVAPGPLTGARELTNENRGGEPMSNQQDPTGRANLTGRAVDAAVKADPTGRSLLEALEQNPKEHDRRLVFADWLEEHGMDEEARRGRMWAKVNFLLSQVTEDQWAEREELLQDLDDATDRLVDAEGEEEERAANEENEASQDLDVWCEELAVDLCGRFEVEDEDYWDLLLRLAKAIKDR